MYTNIYNKSSQQHIEHTLDYAIYQLNINKLHYFEIL